MSFRFEGSSALICQQERTREYSELQLLGETQSDGIVNAEVRRRAAARTRENDADARSFGTVSGIGPKRVRVHLAVCAYQPSPTCALPVSTQTFGTNAPFSTLAEAARPSVGSKRFSHPLRVTRPDLT
jgi:hypothetical protein